MAGRRELLLLAVILLPVVRCQHKPNVSMIPSLKQIFTGDFFSLDCEGGQSGSPVTWSVNGSSLPEKNKILKIAAASPRHSGDYRCTINGQESDNLLIQVYEFVPIASLTIRTGQPVMRKSSIVLLELTKDDGLEGWMCRVKRGGKTNRVMLNLENGNPTSFIFETTSLTVTETIYWCVNKKDENYRSNQVVLRTTEKEVSMEMYPFPAILGEKMTLKCLVWGAEQVFESVFYKDGVIFTKITEPEFDITEAKESTEGRYKCEATYKYKDQTVETPHKYDSDAQEVPVYVRPVRAELSDSMGCSCSSCDSTMYSRFYKLKGNSWTMHPGRPNSDGGTYCCRAFSKYMRTLPSNPVRNRPSINGLVIGILVFIFLGGLIIFVLVYQRWNERRRAAVDIYEQVPMRGDPNYDALNVKQVKEGEYDTLQTEAEGRQKTGGEYQALTKREGKDEVYHTLGEASGGGEGAYEALKTAGVQKDEYDTLKTKQAEARPGREDGGDGGYEALKTAGVQKDEYDTLKTKQAEARPGREDGGDGGYEALKTAGVQKDEYETLKTKRKE